MRKHSRAFSLKRPVLLAVLVIVLAAVVFSLAYKAIHDWEFADSQPDQTRKPQHSLADDSGEEERPMICYNDKWYVLRDDLEAVLLMGLDKYEEDLNDSAIYRNNQQTDFMLLLVLDRKNESYRGIHLNRDTMTRIPTLGVDGRFVNYINAQLTLAHTYGSGGTDSCKNAVRAVSEFLYGMEIEHYLAVTMDAVQILNDAVGGVSITLEEDFPLQEDLVPAGSTITLHGSEALSYVRARGGLEDSSNLSRMKRQRQFLNALYEEIEEHAEADSGFLTKTILSINDYLTSDCTIQQLSDLAESMDHFAFLGIEETVGEAVKGEKYMEYYADEEALQELLIDVFYEPTNTH